VVAAQAVDIGKRPRLAPATRVLYEAIRESVPMLVEDRETGPDAMKTLAVIAQPAFIAALRQAMPADAAGAFALSRKG
jgi:histidine ammonia-lyase